MVNLIWLRIELRNRHIYDIVSILFYVTMHNLHRKMLKLYHCIKAEEGGGEHIRQWMIGGCDVRGWNPGRWSKYCRIKHWRTKCLKIPEDELLEDEILDTLGWIIMSPPILGETYCLCTFCLSVSPSVYLLQNLVLTSRTRRLTWETWNFVQCFIIISRCAYCQDRRIQKVFFELWWIKVGWRIWNSLSSLLLRLWDGWL
jgi:hypothetical protein